MVWVAMSDVAETGALSQPDKNRKRKTGQTRLGLVRFCVSRTIYVNVDSPNLFSEEFS